MGQALVECVSGCTCEDSVLDGWWERHASLQVMHTIMVSWRGRQAVAGNEPDWLLDWAAESGTRGCKEMSTGKAAGIPCWRQHRDCHRHRYRSIPSVKCGSRSRRVAAARARRQGTR